jgi:hypothetical protein
MRMRLKLNEKDALYMFVNNKELLRTEMSLLQAYNNYKDDDGFLYITYMEMNTFGTI